MRYPSPTRGLFPLAVLATGFFCIGRAAAQESSPVYVAFELRGPVTKLFPAGPGLVERQISRALVAICRSHFGYWNFQPHPSDVLDRVHPALRCWLEKGGGGDWSLRLQFVPIGRHDSSDAKAASLIPPDKLNWTTALFSPGELDRLGGLPQARRFPDWVAARFTGRLLASHRSNILNSLREFAPLGESPAPAKAPPLARLSEAEAVLPLNWKTDYRDLALSKFRIVCRNGAKGIVILHSFGIGQPGDYTPEKPQYQGITVRHRRWEEAGVTVDLARKHLRPLGQLKSSFFYLEEFNPQGLSLSADGPWSVAP